MSKGCGAGQVIDRDEIQIRRRIAEGGAQNIAANPPKPLMPTFTAMCAFSFKKLVRNWIENVAFGGYKTAQQAIPPNP